MDYYVITKKKIAIAAAIVAIVGLLAVWKISRSSSEGEFVRGEYGKICYARDSVSRQVKKPVSFKSLGECLKSIKK